VSFLAFYTLLYICLCVIPALIRTFIDIKVLKLRNEIFLLPPATIKFDKYYEGFAVTGLLAPFLEEIAFRGASYLLLGFTGLVIGNIVWILAHPQWQLKYLPPNTPVKTKIGFVLNAIFYYSCASIFFSYAWINGYGLYAVLFHILHNTGILAGSIVTEKKLGFEKPEIFREEKQSGKVSTPATEIFIEKKPVKIPITLDAEFDPTEFKFFKDFSTPTASATIKFEELKWLNPRLRF